MREYSVFISLCLYVLVYLYFPMSINILIFMYICTPMAVFVSVDMRYIYIFCSFTLVYLVYLWFILIVSFFDFLSFLLFISFLLLVCFSVYFSVCLFCLCVSWCVHAFVCMSLCVYIYICWCVFGLIFARRCRCIYLYIYIYIFLSKLVSFSVYFIVHNGAYFLPEFMSVCVS